MISSYEDYQYYLEADRIALGRKKNIRSLLVDDIWKFQRLLRKMEYIVNCKKYSLQKKIVSRRLQKLGTKLGFSIPINVFGPGLSIAHKGTIVINSGAKIGSNCRLHVCVNIGTEAGKSHEAPIIGDNCYIAPGVKMFGKINIGSNTIIGANAVVNNSFSQGNITIGGIPAKIISNKTTIDLQNKKFD